MKIFLALLIAFVLGHIDPPKAYNFSASTFNKVSSEREFVSPVLKTGSHSSNRANQNNVKFPLNVIADDLSFQIKIKLSLYNLVLFKSPASRELHLLATPPPGLS